MEVEKTKGLDDGEVDGKKVTGSKRERDGEKTVTENIDDDDDHYDDGEVEEFFAILRRIHVAVKYFEKGDGGNKRLLTSRPWSPIFQREDFEGANAIKDQESEEQNVVLDLNSDPAAEDKI